MHFDLTDLKVFVCIAEAPSLTQGAKTAFVSPAAARTRLKNLEAQLSSRLFYRHNKGLELTPAGKNLLRHARLMLQYAEQIRTDFSGYAADTQGHIRIYANTTAVIGFLPEILALFLAERPAVSIDLQEQFTKDIIRSVREDAADFGIVSGQIDAPDLQRIHFSTDRLCVAVPQGHELAKHTAVDFQAALAYPHIGFHRGSTLQQYVDEHKQRLGVSTKNRINVSGFESVCRLIEAGVGIGIVPESVIERHRHTMAIVAVPLDDPSAVRERSIILKELDALTPVSRALIERISLHMQAPPPISFQAAFK